MFWTQVPSRLFKYIAKPSTESLRLMSKWANYPHSKTLLMLRFSLLHVPSNMLFMLRSSLLHVPSIAHQSPSFAPGRGNTMYWSPLAIGEVWNNSLDPVSFARWREIWGPSFAPRSIHWSNNGCTERGHLTQVQIMSVEIWPKSWNACETKTWTLEVWHKEIQKKVVCRSMFWNRSAMYAVQWLDNWNKTAFDDFGWIDQYINIHTYLYIYIYTYRSVCIYIYMYT